MNKPTKRPCCPDCGSETGIYARADIRWMPETQTWEVLDIEEELDCTECDHAWSYGDSAFPDPLQAINVETAMCLWEAFLEARTGDEAKPSLADRMAQDGGTAAARSLVEHWAIQCEADWQALSEDEQSEIGAFDWEFCPDWLERKLRQHYSVEA